MKDKATKKCNYKFFANKNCEYFPCHEGIENFNCMFCYCPLYALNKDCGGNYAILDNGIKDCSKCIYPHLGEDGYEFILKRINKVIETVRNYNN